MTNTTALRHRSWLAWAVIAAQLLFLGGMLILGAIEGHGYSAGRHDISDLGALTAHHATAERNDDGRWVDRWLIGSGPSRRSPLPDVDAAVVEARCVLDDLGADGVALLTNQASIHQGDSQLDPLGAELNHRDAAVFVHPTVGPR